MSAHTISHNLTLIDILKTKIYIEIETFNQVRVNHCSHTTYNPNSLQVENYFPFTLEEAKCTRGINIMS